MRGATAPRLLLELMCARILLPGLDDSAEGLGARLDRVERRLSVVGTPSRPASEVQAPDAARQGLRPGPQPDGLPAPAQPASATGAATNASPPADDDTLVHGTATNESSTGDGTPAGGGGARPAAMSAPSPRAPSTTDRSQSKADPAADPPHPVRAASADLVPEPGGLSLVDVRRLWPGVLARVQGMRRYAWAVLSQNAQVIDVAGGVITIGLVNAGARDSFVRGGHDEILRQALIDELGVDWKVEAIIDGSALSGRTSRQTEPSSLPVPPSSPPGSVGRAEPSPRVEAAKEAVRSTRARSGKADQPDEPPPEVRDDDAVIDDAATSSQELLARELGAEIIDDFPHDTK